MKKVFFIIFSFTLFFSHSIFAASRGAQDVVIKGRAPAGIVVKKNSVVIKKGYTVEKVSKGKARLIGKMRGGGTGITGNFDCTCNGKDGGCDVIVTPSSVSCAVSSCTSSCYMIVTVPGAGTVMH